MAKYCYGDYVRIDVLSGPQLDEAISVWMRVERCDDRHSIVYGIVDDKGSKVFDRALSTGARLAASYRRIRERRTSIEQ